jgi:hypothetical protein
MFVRNIIFNAKTFRTTVYFCTVQNDDTAPTSQYLEIYLADEFEYYINRVLSNYGGTNCAIIKTLGADGLLETIQFGKSALTSGFTATFQNNGAAFLSGNNLVATTPVYSSTASVLTLNAAGVSVSVTFEIPNDGSFEFGDVYNTPVGMVINSVIVANDKFTVSATCAVPANTVFNITPVVVALVAPAIPYYNRLVTLAYTMNGTEKKAWNNFVTNITAAGITLGAGNDLDFLYLLFEGAAGCDVVECIDPTAHDIVWSGSVFHSRGGAKAVNIGTEPVPVFSGYGNTGLDLSARFASQLDCHLGVISRSQQPRINTYNSGYDMGTSNGSGTQQMKLATGSTRSYIGALGNGFDETTNGVNADAPELRHLIVNRNANNHSEFFADGLPIAILNANVNVAAIWNDPLSVLALNINGAGPVLQSGRKLSAVHGGKAFTNVKSLALYKELTVLSYYFKRSII